MFVCARARVSLCVCVCVCVVFEYSLLLGPCVCVCVCIYIYIYIYSIMCTMMLIWCKGHQRLLRADCVFVSLTDHSLVKSHREIESKEKQANGKLSCEIS